MGSEQDSDARVTRTRRVCKSPHRFRDLPLAQEHYPAVDPIVELSKSCIRHVETPSLALSRIASFVEVGSFCSVLLMAHIGAGVRRSEEGPTPGGGVRK